MLLILLNENISITVGALGRIKFPPGIYAYVGSAQNNLEKRVQRHFSKDKKKFWHIDYFLNTKYSTILEVLFKKAGKAEECRLAKEIAKIGNSVKGFGCSECACSSHFFQIPDIGAIKSLGLRPF